MKSLLLILFFLCVAACSSNRGAYKTEKEIENRLVGMTELNLATRIGSPTERNKLSDGTDVWTYRDDAEGLTGGECTVTLVLQEGVAISASVVAR